MFADEEEVGGATVADHVEALRRQGIVVPADDAGGDDAPEPPEEAAYLWGWWLELHAARSGNGFGPNPIEFRELAAWSQLCDIRLEPWEARAIRAIDNTYLTATASKKPAGG